MVRELKENPQLDTVTKYSNMYCSHYYTSKMSVAPTEDAGVPGKFGSSVWDTGTVQTDAGGIDGFAGL